MRIALINEDSQADKNELIFDTLTAVAGKYGHTVDNYGMYSENDEHTVNYIQVGILASILLETQMADFVVTGCGTGQGAMISCNAFANVVCGYASAPLDAYLFSQINAGKAISIPFAQQFGWGSEVNLSMLFEHLFAQPFGGGYPRKYADEESVSRVRMRTDIKERAQKDVLSALEALDREDLKKLLQYPTFTERFQQSAQDGPVRTFIEVLLSQ